MNIRIELPVNTAILSDLLRGLPYDHVVVKEYGMALVITHKDNVTPDGKLKKEATNGGD